MARALNGDHDLVLLDVMLPIVSGFTVAAVAPAKGSAGDHADGED